MRLLLAAGAGGDEAPAVVLTGASNLSLVDVARPDGGVRQRLANLERIAAARLLPTPCA